jgi:hypothetical protein
MIGPNVFLITIAPFQVQHLIVEQLFDFGVNFVLEILKFLKNNYLN